MTSTTVEQYVQCILSVLDANRETQWSKAALIRTVESQVGGDKGRIRTIIYSLAEGGTILSSGYGQNLFDFRYKPPTTGNRDNTQDTSEESRQLRNQLRETEQRYQRAKQDVLDVAHRATKQHETVVKELKEKLAKTENNVVRVELKRPGKKTKVTKGLFNAQFKTILKLAEARMNIFLYGPTGCGKSHVCEQIAEALDLSFSFVSCTGGMSEGVLAGRLLPTGDQGTFEYVISEFINAYENGGVFLLDEIDAADPNVLLLINAALANGKVAVSNRPDKPYATRHPDFICIAAANTVGTGADRLYSGRNKLDAATLDRFQIGKVLMGYDERVETDLCPDATLRSRLLRYRKAIDAHRLERVVSTRFLRDSYRMTNDFGWDYDKIDKALFAGWREDEVNKVKSHRG